MTEITITRPVPATGSRPRVVVFDPIPGDWSFDPEKRVLEERGAELVVPADEASADSAIDSADVIIVTGVRRLDAAAIARLDRCIGILCYSIGMDKVDRPAADAAGIPVRNVPDYCTDEVSDHAMALLLAAQRRVVQFASASAAGRWRLDDRTVVASMRRLRGQTLGIAGIGRIGRLVARKAQAFGFRTIAFDPFVAESGDAAIELVTHDEMMRRSDAIVVCAALTPGSPPLIGRSALALVRPGLILVNVSRGGHVDEAALAEALADGRVAVAALDVRAVEPPDPSTDPLTGLPNVIQTPHVAASSREASEDLHRLAAEHVLAFLEGADRLPVAG